MSRQQLFVTLLEDRTNPADFTVSLNSAGAGVAGSTAASISGTLALNSQLPTNGSGAAMVVAATPTQAVELALVGTITATFAGETLTYPMGTGAVGAYT